MENLSDLKAGDKVILIERCWSGDIESIRKIDKITPSGLIRIGHDYFRQSGSIRASGVFNRIERYTKERESKIMRKQLERKTVRDCIETFDKRRFELDYEKAKKILDVLKGEKHE